VLIACRAPIFDRADYLADHCTSVSAGLTSDSLTGGPAIWWWSEPAARQGGFAHLVGVSWRDLSLCACGMGAGGPAAERPIEVFLRRQPCAA